MKIKNRWLKIIIIIIIFPLVLIEDLLEIITDKVMDIIEV